MNKHLRVQPPLRHTPTGTMASVAPAVVVEQKEEPSNPEMVPARLTASFCSPFCVSPATNVRLTCGSCDAVFYTCPHAMERVERAALFELHPLCPACAALELQHRLSDSHGRVHICIPPVPSTPSTCPICQRAFVYCNDCRTVHLHLRDRVMCTMCTDAFV